MTSRACRLLSLQFNLHLTLKVYGIDSKSNLLGIMTVIRRRILARACFVVGRRVARMICQGQNDREVAIIITLRVDYKVKHVFVCQIKLFTARDKCRSRWVGKLFLWTIDKINKLKSIDNYNVKRSENRPVHRPPTKIWHFVISIILYRFSNNSTAMPTNISYVENTTRNTTVQLAHWKNFTKMLQA